MDQSDAESAGIFARLESCFVALVLDASLSERKGGEGSPARTADALRSARPRQARGPISSPQGGRGPIGGSRKAGVPPRGPTAGLGGFRYGATIGAVAHHRGGGVG
eukprot:960642-Prorocentrum_minimum.AAC.1